MEALIQPPLALQLTIATGNPNKVAEIEAMLGPLPINVQRQPDDLDVEETGSNYLENAELKASAAALRTKGWALADDSGLEVDALGGGSRLPVRLLAVPHRLQGDREGHGGAVELLHGFRGGFRVGARQRTASHQQRAGEDEPDQTRSSVLDNRASRTREVPMVESRPQSCQNVASHVLGIQ